MHVQSCLDPPLTLRHWWCQARPSEQFSDASRPSHLDKQPRNLEPGSIGPGSTGDPFAAINAFSSDTDDACRSSTALALRRHRNANGNANAATTSEQQRCREWWWSSFFLDWRLFELP